MADMVIGMDIGGTNTVLGTVDKFGNCTNKKNLTTNEFENPEEFVLALANEINSILDADKSLKLIGIGIGAPNGNFFSGTIEDAPNLRWKGVIPFTSLMKRHFNVPVLLTNDANAAALGEKIYGGAKDMKNFILITLGTGLGSGFVVNGDLLYGHDGFAGELGHIIAIDDGRKCGCGRKGCLETYVSAPGITKTTIEILNHTRIPSSLRGVPKEDLNSKMIFEAAEENDLAALKAFDFTAHLLGRKLADIVAITSPEAIFLFGGLAQAGDLILQSTKNYMERYLLNIFKNKVQLLASQLPENNSAILGAAALVLNSNEVRI